MEIRRKMDKKTIINSVVEALKEGMRLVGLAVIPIVLAGINAQTGDIDINIKLVIAVALITLLRSIDKFLHEIGKNSENKLLSGGLTRF